MEPFTAAFSALGGASSPSSSAASGDVASKQDFSFGGSVGGDFLVSGIGTGARGSVDSAKGETSQDAFTFIAIGLGFVLILGAISKIK